MDLLSVRIVDEGGQTCVAVAGPACAVPAFESAARARGVVVQGRLAPVDAVQAAQLLSLLDVTAPLRPSVCATAPRVGAKGTGADGQGLVLREDGVAYAGAVDAEGRPHGEGLCAMDADGALAVYEGQWKRGVPHGAGVQVMPGELFVGRFRHGERVQGENFAEKHVAPGGACFQDVESTCESTAASDQDLLDAESARVDAPENRVERALVAAGGALSAGARQRVRARALRTLQLPGDVAAKGIPEFLKPFRLVGPTARGGFATVTKATCADGAVAVKRGVAAEVRVEAAVLSALPAHAHIVTFHGLSAAQDLVLEWLPRSLYSAIHEARTALPVADILNGIASALAHVHAHGFVHLDVKSPNVMLTRTLAPKLCDFGRAEYRTDARTARMLGTPHWAAPEVCQEVSAGSPADVWSWGVLAVEFATRSVPFRGLSVAQVLLTVAFCEAPLQVPSGAFADAALAGHVRACLQRAPELRPSAGALASATAVQQSKVPSCFDFLFGL